MSNITLTSKISRNPDVSYTQIDNDLVMMGPKDDLFYGVNDTGTKIWSLLEFNDLTFGAIHERIQQEYEVTEAACLEDLTQFVEAMVAQNMLVVIA